MEVQHNELRCHVSALRCNVSFLSVHISLHWILYEYLTNLEAPHKVAPDMNQRYYTGVNRLFLTSRLHTKSRPTPAALMQEARFEVMTLQHRATNSVVVPYLTTLADAAAAPYRSRALDASVHSIPLCVAAPKFAPRRIISWSPSVRRSAMLLPATELMEGGRKDV